ncbi:G2/M phase-specific E3 ubiquitin-protein ligase [Dissostichus eleginoides]|uniref:G2/M phase-specific E3 ubiquitin-protein ligase n=1 Tax=Dissostichus eleginoides TaxID=100907 RepID=A0AAD9C097_DISEL|nr:G2/M phase-specific E3 ubiquitin-protein ligase [Dissostichus eleginoides]
MAKQHFLKLLVQQIQDSEVFEGPEGSKNLALDSKALRDDLYFDAGCCSLSLWFTCLFNYPPNQPLSVKHMTPYTHFTCQVSRIAEAESLDDVKDVMEESWEFMELAGCNRPISSRLQEREALVEDLVSFMMITRLQLPLQRFREGLQTLGVFDQVQLFPAVFLSVFCDTTVRLSAQTVDQIFTVNFSEQEERLSPEKAVVAFWRNFLQDYGKTSISLQDLLSFSTGSENLPVSGLLPPPSISFLHPVKARRGESSRIRKRKEVCRDEGLFPQSKPASKHLLLPISSSYQAFKSSMEQVISHHVQLLPTES